MTVNGRDASSPGRHHAVARAGRDGAGRAPDGATAGPRRLTTAQAAARLGVKPETLYAYVSRGLLHPERAPDGRGSRFDPAEVERLAARGRHAAPAPAAGPSITSALTAVADGRLYYRGLPAGELARTWPFEAVAEWLWSGAVPARAVWSSQPAAVAAAGAAQAALPAAVRPLGRLRLIAAALAAMEGMDTAAPAPASPRRRARTLIAGLVDSLPPAIDTGAGSSTARIAPATRPGAPVPETGERSAPPDSIAARLWSRLCPSPPDGAMIAILNAALVLLADHELTASTFAARVAASAGGDLYAAVGAGLAVLGGARHGSASTAMEALLDGFARLGVAALDERIRAGTPPGFGQPLYPDGDPRAAQLVALMHTVPAWAGRMQTVEALLEAAHTRGLPPPNVDFALAALAHAAGMIPGAAPAILAVARSAGWIAHAFEEQEQGARVLPAARYTGPPPQVSVPLRPSEEIGPPPGELAQE